MKLRFPIPLLALSCVLLDSRALATNYYVNSSTGNDSNAGTSTSAAWSSFTNINSHTFVAGDIINLACGCTWNQELDLVGTGSSANWITLTSYGTGNKPAIIRDGLAMGSAAAKSERCLVLTNPDYWNISNLEVGYAGAGILVQVTSISHQGLNFTNIYAHHCAGIAFGSGDGSFENLSQSAGIALAGTPSLTATQYAIKDINFTNIEGTHNGSSITVGLLGTMTDGSDGHTVTQNLTCNNIYLHDDDANGVANDCAGSFVWQDAENVTVMNSVFDSEAAGYTSTGTAATYLGAVQNFYFMNSVIKNTPNELCPDMTGWDNEGFTTNVNFEGTFFTGNAGAGIEFLAIHGSASQDTLNNVLGSMFVQNGTAGGTNGFAAAMAVVGTNVTVTGTVQNNLYWQQSGSLMGGSGSSSGFTFSNNLMADQQGDVYNAGYDFGSVQGSHQWSYQLYDGTSWTNLSNYNAVSPSPWSSWSGSSNAAIVWAQAQQPDANNSDWVARTWTAPSKGLISIRGWAASQVGQSTGSGALIKITQNTTSIWGGTGTLIASGNSTGVATNVDVAVAAGDVIRFQINDNGASNNSGDIVSWAPNIAYTYTEPTLASVPTLANPGFESPATSNYSYGPFTSGWAFGTGAGVTIAAGAFGAPAAPQGTQMAFLQASSLQGSSVSQTVTFNAGTYDISYYGAQRSSGSAQQLMIYVDGNSVGANTGAGTAFANYTTDNFTVSAGSHTISIQGVAAGNSTMFIDSVAINQGSAILANPSFESPAVSNYSYGPFTSGWTFNGSSGLSANGGSFGAPAAPIGGQVAFLQGGTAALSQAVTVPAGTYWVTFMASQRTTFGGAQSISITVDGTNEGTWSSLPGGVFEQEISLPFNLTAGSHTIQFNGLNLGDNTAFIDAVSMIRAL